MKRKADKLTDANTPATPEANTCAKHGLDVDMIHSLVCRYWTDIPLAQSIRIRNNP